MDTSQISENFTTPILRKIAGMIDNFNVILGRMISWLVLLLVVFVGMITAQRYFFSANYVWQTEFILYIHSLIFLASAGYVLHSNAHVRVDVLYEKLTDRVKIYCNLLGIFLFLFPVTFAIFYFSYDFILNSWEISEKSREYGGIPALYVLKSFIYLFSFTLFIQGISISIKSYEALFNKKSLKIY